MSESNKKAKRTAKAPAPRKRSAPPPPIKMPAAPPRGATRPLAAPAARLESLTTSPTPATAAPTAKPASAAYAGAGVQDDAQSPAFVQLLRVAVAGWGAVIRRAALRVRREAERLTLIQSVFVLLSLALGGFASLRWLQFELNLMSPETVSVGSASRLYFALPALIGLFGALLDIPWRLRVYYASALLAGVLYLLGFFAPAQIHAKVLNFGWTPWIFAYGVTLLLQALTARAAIATPLFRFEQLRDGLMRRLEHGAAKGGERRSSGARA